MPTARPIIIEKFIDHTDSGVAPVEQVEGGEADGDAGQGQQQRDAGGDGRAEGHEQQDDRGEAREQLGLVQGLLVLVVEVAPHRPLAGHLGLGAVGQGRRSSTWSMSFPAGLGQVGVLAGPRGARGSSAVCPSGEISPASGGWPGGSTTEAAPGASWRSATSGWSPAGSSAIGVGLAVDDDGRLGPERGEVPAELVADLLGDRALGLPAGAGQGPGQGEGERGRGERQHQPQGHDRPAPVGGEAGQAGEPGRVGTNGVVLARGAVGIGAFLDEGHGGVGPLGAQASFRNIFWTSARS